MSSANVRPEYLDACDLQSEALHVNFVLELFDRLRRALDALKAGHAGCHGAGCVVCELLKVQLPSAETQDAAERSSDDLFIEAARASGSRAHKAALLEHFGYLANVVFILDSVRHARQCIGHALQWASAVLPSLQDEEWEYVTGEVLPSARWMLEGLETSIGDRVEEVSVWEGRHGRKMGETSAPRSSSSSSPASPLAAPPASAAAGEGKRTPG